MTITEVRIRDFRGIKDLPAMIAFENLNENQRRAVEWNGGPLLVLAGPGSGKTGVLTLRVARLLQEDEDASALALTFTNKAAAEMRERVDQLLGARSDRAHLCTFHSFAADVLAQHGSHLGIRPHFRPLARDEDRLAILEEVVRHLPGGGWELPPDRRNVLKLIDRLFSESYLGNGPSASLTTTPPWLPRLFRRYCGALLEANRLIYQWNGASPKRFRDLRQDYELGTLHLPKSYRCPQAIVSLANRLIARNRDRFTAKKTVSVRDPGRTYPSPVRYEVLPSPRGEAEFVARDIGDRELRPSECVVLGRTNRLVSRAAETLRGAGHDADVPRKKSEFDSPVLNVLVEALRLANSRHDRVVLRRICLAWEGMTGVAIDPDAVRAAAALVGGDFLRAWVDMAAAAAADEGRNALRCMTVHAAKGLEFEHVYLIGMAQEVFPFYRAVQAGQMSREIEEERRSCFVAITRARKTLTLTRSMTYYGYSKDASQFLREMGVTGDRTP